MRSCKLWAFSQNRNFDYYEVIICGVLKGSEWNRNWKKILFGFSVSWIFFSTRQNVLNFSSTRLRAIRIWLELWLSNIGFLESFLSKKNSTLLVEKKLLLKNYPHTWGFRFIEQNGLSKTPLQKRLTKFLTQKVTTLRKVKFSSVWSLERA